MGDATGVRSQEWLAEVGNWVHSVVAGHDMTVLGAPQEHETRRWSTVWTIATDRGPIWFKQCEASSRTEPAVHRILAQIAPEFVDAPLAVHPGRGWTLTRDGGVTVAETGPAGSRGVVTETVVALLTDAQLQSVLAAGPALTAAAEVLIGGPVPLAFDHADRFPGTSSCPALQESPTASSTSPSPCGPTHSAPWSC